MEDLLLTYASEHGLVDLVEFLLQRVAPTNEVLEYAAMNGHLDIVKLLLPRLQESGGNALLLAAEKGHTHVVRLILKDKRFDPTFSNNLAVRRASGNGHSETVQELLNDQRVNPGDKRNDAIIWACQRGHLNVVRTLIHDRRVDPSDLNNMALRCTTDERIMSELIRSKRVRSKLSTFSAPEQFADIWREILNRYWAHAYSVAGLYRRIPSCIVDKLIIEVKLQDVTPHLDESAEVQEEIFQRTISTIRFR